MLNKSGSGTKTVIGSETGTGTGTSTFPKSEPELKPQKISFHNTLAVFQWDNCDSGATTLLVHKNPRDTR
jgi:hypothetical protein